MMINAFGKYFVPRRQLVHIDRAADQYTARKAHLRIRIMGQRDHFPGFVPVDGTQTFGSGRPFFAPRPADWIDRHGARQNDRIFPRHFRRLRVVRNNDTGVTRPLGKLQMGIFRQILRGDGIADYIGGDHSLPHFRMRLQIVAEQIQQDIRTLGMPGQNKWTSLIEVPDIIIKSGQPISRRDPANHFSLLRKRQCQCIRGVRLSVVGCVQIPHRFKRRSLE